MSRKLILTILAMALIMSAFATIPELLTKKGNHELYTKLMPLARQNLTRLQNPKSFKNLLKQHDDILMAYLIAYESDANLAQANPQDIMSNYEQVVRLFQVDGLNYSPEFFLSYIAKQTVSDERISAYRKAMLDDGLRNVLISYSDPLERFRATTLWCVEKLQFQQTSGRDQNPMDIMNSSLIGRCEEMQILLVAALRTVGLPARPASTPWWAHMDNNHAWAEVWLENAWHYTGDMDAAYFPDQTWFSGMIDKTVMILADGSLAAENDEVLISGRYDTVINSTPSYARERTRTIIVKTVNEAGDILPDVQISIMVFNWGALRPIISLSSNDKGELSFSAGRGSFYLSAYKDGIKTLVNVESNSDPEQTVNLVLNEAQIPEQSLFMLYTGNEMNWQNPPDSYKDEVTRRKALWQKGVDTYLQSIDISVFDDSLSYSVATACRGNYPAFSRFYTKNKPVSADFLEFLSSYDPKFLWQADAELFEATYNHFLAWASVADLPAEVFYPSVHYEELPMAVYKSKNKAYLYPKAFTMKGKTDADKIDKLFKWLSKRYKVNNEKALRGLLRLDIAARQKHLTSYQYRILAINALRANGIAAEFTRVPDNILIHLDGDWQYYDVKEGKFTQRSTETNQRLLKLNITDADGIPLQVNPEQYSLTRYVDGVFYSLNTRFEYLGSGNYQAQIPDTDLYLQFGYRVSDSQTGFRLYAITPDTETIRIIADAYPHSWNPAEEDILALIPAEVLEADSLIVLGNIDQENSLRIVSKIQESGRKYRFFGFTDSPKAPEQYTLLPSWQSLVQSDNRQSQRSITLIKDKDGWKMYDGLWERLP